jgi:hypothetical protein
MSEIANWTVQVQIQGGKTINLGGQQQADGFDKLSPTIPASSDGKAASTKSVPVDAGAKLLLVSTEDKSGKLSVTFGGSGGTPASQSVSLTQDAPLFFIGQQIIASQVNGGAGKTAQLTFSNTNQQAIIVDILILSDLG